MEKSIINHITIVDERMNQKLQKIKEILYYDFLIPDVNNIIIEYCCYEKCRENTGYGTYFKNGDGYPSYGYRLFGKRIGLWILWNVVNGQEFVRYVYKDASIEHYYDNKLQVVEHVDSEKYTVREKVPTQMFGDSYWSKLAKALMSKNWHTSDK